MLLRVNTTGEENKQPLTKAKDETVDKDFGVKE